CHHLTRHGNIFRSNRCLTATQPGAIKNIHSTAAQQITAKTPLYNPLNRHGNTFLKIASLTAHSSRLKIFTAAQQITAAKTPLYNPLNQSTARFFRE
ncbi:hypothetical protein, partial [Pantoea stewartii]|uniref:hypothetical protein n=1 Tax=Pantoea stewartii TaxID=66269 RepID=UPI0025A09FC9